MAKGNIFKHWPTWLLGLVVVAVLVVAIFSFQLNQTESAVVVTLGEPAEVNTPGLHHRWPFPFQKVHKFDHRIRCFEGSAGKVEEIMTADGQNILVGIYVNYKIGDARQFFVSLKDITNAEEQLNSLMRGAKHTTFGKYKFNQVINTEASQMKLGEIQDLIQKELVKNTQNYGIEVVSVGINSINVPKAISEKVFERMVDERKVEANRFLGQGSREASDIRNKANQDRAQELARAEADARMTRAKGDAQAAESYKIFQENPELAEYLRKLESLRIIMAGQTTLVLDTDVEPFTLLKPGAGMLGPVKPAEKK